MNKRLKDVKSKLVEFTKDCQLNDPEFSARVIGSVLNGFGHEIPNLSIYGDWKQLVVTLHDKYEKPLQIKLIDLIALACDKEFNEDN